MTRTYLADAVAAGADLRAGVRAERLVVVEGRCRGVVVRDAVTGRTEELRAGMVVVCGGAIQTPALLLRSGVTAGGEVGRHLAVHPTVKAVARFRDEVNDPADVATYQVKFGSWLSIGGSASGPPLLALHLADSWPAFGSRLADWRRSTSYYAAITSTGRGRVRVVRGRTDPLVTYALTSQDISGLRTGMARLLHLLLAAGADEVYPGTAGAAVVRDATDVPMATTALGRTTASVMTVHLMGTARMGGERLGRRVRLLGTGPRGRGPAGQRRVALPRGGGCEPAGHPHGPRPPQRRGDAPLMAPVLVLTGAAGWLGRALLDRLRREPELVGGGPVRVVVAAPLQVPDVLAVHPGVEVFVGDVADVTFRGPGPRGRRRCRARPRGRGHPPGTRRGLRAGQRAGHPRGRGRGGAGRHPPAGAHLLQLPVRRQPTPGRRLPARGALPALPRVRRLQDGGRGRRACGTAASRR